MDKKGRWILWVSIILVIVLVIIFFFYFALFNPRNSVYEGQEITNPAFGMTAEQARISFDESFVFYLLYSIKAYNLHNPPLSSNVPKIEIHVEGEIFNAVIESGAINVEKGSIAEKDIIITTNKDEAIKMMNDKNYVTESFNAGKSTIELVADKTTLFAKGYLGLYNELTGKSITGNVIRIYLD